MSRPESSSSASRHHDEEEDSVDEIPRKQMKLDPEAQQSALVNSVECEVPASKAKMDDLPDLVIVTILSFLSFGELTEVVPNVCTKWRRSLSSPKVWRNKTFYVHGRLSEAEVLATLNQVPQLHSLVMREIINDAVVNALCNKCRHLERLNIAGWKLLNDSLLNKLMMNNPNIKSLTIPESVLLYKSNARVLAQLLQLQSLEVVGELHCWPIYLAPLGNGCPMLSKLKMLRMDCLSPYELNQFLEGKYRTLTHLKLSWIDIHKRCILPLLKDCSNLVKLKLCDDSNRIGEVLEACTALKHLSNFRSLCLVFDDDETLANAIAFKSGPFLHLQVLKICELCLQNSVFVAIFEGCPNLKEFRLQGCSGLDDGDLKELHRLSKLEVLCLAYCEDVRAAALRHVSQVPNLQKLWLAGCDFRDMKNTLSFLLDIHTLETLSFFNSRYVCYFHFERIPEMLPNLRFLDVESCELDPRPLQQIKTQMPRLQIHFDRQ